MENVKNTCIKAVTIVDPNSPFHLKKMDVWIEKGRIKKIAKSIVPATTTTIVEGKEMFLSTGWIDGQVRVGEPGNEDAETFATASLAATKGGITDVVVFPSHNPPTYQAAQVAYIKQNGQNGIKFHPVGCLSEQMKGKQLSEMFDMKNAGAIAFSDDKSAVSTTLLARALEYSKTFNGLVIVLPFNHELNPGGLMHEGKTSTQMGTKGLSNVSEYMQIQRDIEILKYTGGRLHFSNISCSESVDIIRKAKKSGLAVTCGIAAHQLSFIDEDLKLFPSNLKTLPPFRTSKDRDALIKGLADNTIDIIMSDHTPVVIEEKNVEFEYASFGISSIQHAFQIAFTALEGDLSLEEIIKKWTTNPSQIFGIPTHRIEEGETLRATLFTTAENTLVNKKDWKSKSANSPFIGEWLSGRVIDTYCS
jgi:dihydroorotase